MKIVLIKLMLLGKIKTKKREMYRLARHFGLTNPRVVACSQELDILLNKYQEILVFQPKCDTFRNCLEDFFPSFNRIFF